MCGYPDSKTSVSLCRAYHIETNPPATLQRYSAFREVPNLDFRLDWCKDYADVQRTGAYSGIYREKIRVYIRNGLQRSKTWAPFPLFLLV